VKAVILAAGLGTRMRPLTDKTAKPALPVLNEPLIVRTLRELKRAGVSEVMINLHHRPETIRAAIPEGGLGLKIKYSRETAILGTGGALRKVRSWVGRNPLFVVNGDVIFDFDLKAMAACHRKTDALATLALKPNSNPRRYKPVVTDRGGRILSIRARPKVPKGTVSLFASVHLIEPAILDRLPPGTSDTVGDLYIPLLREGAHLQGVRQKGVWHDLGSPVGYLKAQMRLLADRGRKRSVLMDPSVRLGKGARVVRSVVGAGCVIESASRIEGSVLWDGALVKSGASLRNCIVMTGTVVKRGKYQGLILGPRTRTAIGKE
jgi:NDP-sugar pyrophosphorylase family protein